MAPGVEGAGSGQQESEAGAVRRLRQAETFWRQCCCTATS